MTNMTVLTPIFQYCFSVIRENNLEIAKDTLNKYKLQQEKLLQEQPCPQKIQHNGKKNINILLNNVTQKTVDVLQKVLSLLDNNTHTSVGIENNSLASCDLCPICTTHCIDNFFSNLDKYLTEKKQNSTFNGPLEMYFQKIPESISEIINSKISIHEFYHKLCIQNNKFNNIENKLIILKGMSSSTPSILNSAFQANPCNGGGIYLRWKQHGVVIDPGYRFIDNLHKNNISIMDIDTVIITHNHIDHNNDMRLLDDLHHSLAKNGDISHKITWHVDEVTLSIITALRSRHSGFDETYNEILEINTGEYDVNDALSFNFFPTQHIKQGGKYCDHTFGVNIFCKNDNQTIRTISYTSDTQYFEDLSSYLEKPDILIANISAITTEDVYQVKQKQTHLGFMGCKKLLEENDALTYFLLSEFWSGKGDIRICVSQFLQEQVSHTTNKTQVFPTEVGMTIDLNELQIQCSLCGNNCYSPSAIKAESIIDKINYYCEKCIYTPSAIID